MHPIAFATGFAVAGLAAGAGGRQLLAHLRRGTVVHSGWCALPVAVLWGLVGLRMASGYLPTWWVPIPLTLAWFAVLLTATDLRHRRLPDALTVPAYPAFAALLALASALGGGWLMAAGATLGLAVFLTAHVTVHLLRPHSLGAGDVKLSGSLGAVLGAAGWPTLLLAACLGGWCLTP
jgi:leader peptidase (prepilin peptidase)/N-methyltransferase